MKSDDINVPGNDTDDTLGNVTKDDVVQAESESSNTLKNSTVGSNMIMPDLHNPYMGSVKSTTDKKTKPVMLRSFSNDMSQVKPSEEPVDTEKISSNEGEPLVVAEPKDFDALTNADKDKETSMSFDEIETDVQELSSIESSQDDTPVDQADNNAVPEILVPEIAPVEVDDTLDVDESVEKVEIIDETVDELKDADLKSSSEDITEAASNIEDLLIDKEVSDKDVSGVTTESGAVLEEKQEEATVFYPEQKDVNAGSTTANDIENSTDLIEQKETDSTSESESIEPLQSNPEPDKTESNEILEIVNDDVSMDDVETFKGEVVRIEGELASSESELKDMERQVTMLADTIGKFNKDKDFIEERLQPIEEKEESVEAIIHSIEEEEKNAESSEDRRAIEERRYKEEDRRAKIEQEKWKVGESLEKTIQQMEEFEAEKANIESQKKDISIRITDLSYEKKEKELKINIGETQAERAVALEEKQTSDEKQKEAQERIKVIEEKEKEIESEKSAIEEKEASVGTFADRTPIEKERQDVEMKRREIEQMRWEAEDSFKDGVQGHEDAEKKLADMIRYEDDYRKQLVELVTKKESIKD